MARGWCFVCSKRGDDDWLVLEQHNPPSEIKLAAGTVAAVHKVLTMNELFGV